MTSTLALARPLDPPRASAARTLLLAAGLGAAALVSLRVRRATVESRVPVQAPPAHNPPRKGVQQ